MKNLLSFLAILLVLALTSHLKAQILHEHTYQEANMGGTDRHLELVELDSGEFKYILVDYGESEFTLYNLNHSIYEYVSLPVVWTPGAYNIHMVSRSLFDCDTSNIEYLLSHYCLPHPCSAGGYVEIFRTDGSSIFYSDSAAYRFGTGSSSNLRYPIQSTPEGTKMMLDYAGSGQVRVFSLCGELLVSNQASTSVLPTSLYPNPARNSVTIDYDLPEGETATISLFSMAGQLVRSFNVDSNFDSLIIDTSGLNPGQYQCRVQTVSGEIASSSLVVID